MIDFNRATRRCLPWVLMLGGGMASLIGCGKSDPYELAPVSGVVTLDGQPVAYTRVTFQPQATPDNPAPGPGSTAMCDEAGHFELKTVRDDNPGAVVGAHKVQVSSTGPPLTVVSDGGVGPAPKEAFPIRYNTSSELTFDVPADGTDAANFELTSK